MPDEFFKVDVHILDHEKIVGLSDAAFRVYIGSIAYARRLLTDGFVPEGIARRLHDCDFADPDDDWTIHARELVMAKLWETVEHGFEIHNFAVHNQTKADVEEQRAQWRDRQHRHRERVTRDSRVSHARVTRKEVEVEEEVTPGVVSGDPREETTGVLTVVEQARPEQANIVVVFDAWKATLPPGSRHELTETRRDAIKAALKRYPLDDVLAAVQGWQNDPWPERSQQNDVPQLLWMGTKRKPQNVLEKMRDLHRDGPPVTSNGTSRAARHRAQMVQTNRELDAWAREVDGAGNGVAGGGGQAQRELPRPGDRR